MQYVMTQRVDIGSRRDRMRSSKGLIVLVDTKNLHPQTKNLNKICK